MNEQERQQFEGLYGPLVPGDYELGAIIRYRGDQGQIKRGEVLWRYAAGQTVSGKHHPLTYVVDSGGFPDLCYPTDIIVS